MQWNLTWLFVLKAVVIIASNAATIAIFTRTRRLHNKQHIMIISQAVADLLVGAGPIPLFILYRQINKDYHKAYATIDGFCGGASLFGLAALAIERAHATYFPFRHSTLGKGPYIIGILLMWSTASISCFRPFFWQFVAFTLAIISTSYSLVVIKVRCTSPQAHDVMIQENKKLTVTLAVVTILSLVMWMPYACFTIAFLIDKTLLSRYPNLYYSVKLFQYGNSLVNSLVYAFRMREIKREIFRLFQCCRRNRISISNASELGNI
ncbi:G-protein coupled receptor 6 [Exaiptasia diaphana]|uniref:G-protein coupled receptors family 1 profile domain-containing protein n=1 Tax=Exaiptasia diaphana TaxID=2652724 RepID=A0A913YX01_EXADI|nr:G-protein coupled receptor 6 [Exaiptasia diaphana]